MLKSTTFIAVLLAGLQVAAAQMGGGSAAFGQQTSGGQEALARERAKRSLSANDVPPAGTMFVDASVLMNVLATEFVAVFSVSNEGTTLADARLKSEQGIQAFQRSLEGLGVKPADMFVDFVAQNRIFGYDIEGEVAKERVVGFEVKKNVSVRYRANKMLDRFIAAAAQAEIFDLVKVDYLVHNLAAIQTKLMEEATRVVRRKVANHERLLGTKLKAAPQVYIERYESYFPTEMYSSYVAQESERVSTGFRPNFMIQGARKPRTFYFDALSAKSFDSVVNPVVIEPVIQFTLYLRVKYAMATSPPKRK